MDAENLKLKVNTEQFLASLCDYPLQVKIAFANWKNLSMGKLDAELYDRGYELIHVPGGANSADGKMIAFGAAILYRYRDVRQVFVCSSDGLLNHLCNQLQNQGLTVFRVRRQNAVLSVENLRTGDTNHYSCKREQEVPSLEELANQIGDFLKAEHKSIDERIARFSSVAELFQERRTVAFNSTTPHVAALSESGENEVTPVAEVSLDSVATNHNLLEIIPALNSNPIESLGVLKSILVEIIETAQLELKEEYIPVAKIKKDFFAKYQFHADLIVKQFLGNTSSLIKLFQSASADFKVKLIGSEHQVAIMPKIESSEEG
ncbi:NYN domain-containing protein [Microcoleus sp. POL8_C6]